MDRQPTWESVSAPYVRPQEVGSPDAWAVEAAREGRVGTNRLLEVARVPVPRDIADALLLGQDEVAVVRRRLVLLDDQPIELADSYYPLPIAEGTALAETGKIRGGAITLLAELGYRAHRTVEVVSARPATEVERQALMLEPHDWVLVLNRAIYAHDGTPVEATVMVMIASGRELRYEMIAE